MKQCGTPSKTCEKHGHSAMLQLSHLLLFVPFKELFFRPLFLLRNYFSDNRDTGQLSPGTTWSWVLIGSLEVSFRASLSPQ